MSGRLRAGGASAVRGGKLMEREEISRSGANPGKINRENLWEWIIRHQGTCFYTKQGLPFTYTVKGGELFTQRRRRSITRSTFEKSYEKASSDPSAITGPKKLGVYGATYIWAIFRGMGII